MASLDMNVILVEILPKLPAKSLTRFKSVSKLFQSTISSREFSRLYLRHRSLSSSDHDHDHDHLVLQESHVVTFYNLDSHTISTSLSPFTWNEGSFVGSGFVVGSTNGLVCMFYISSFCSSHFAVFNPYTKMVTFPHLVIGSLSSPRLGFAFDRFNFDHKIVVVSNELYGTHLHLHITRVYSLNTGSWTTIKEIGVPEDTMDIRQSGALINNHLLHWIFRNPSKEARIGCFDVCKMEWTDNVLFPQHCYDPIQKDKVCLLDLGVFDGCLFSLFENLVDSCFDVWVMKEYMHQESWFKFLSIPISDGLPRAMGMVPITSHGGAGEALVRQRGSSRLYLYNTTSGKIREAEFDGAPNFGKYHVYTCSKTRVGIPRGFYFDIENLMLFAPILC